MNQTEFSLMDLPCAEDWTRIKPYGPDAYTYWVKGIYKIVSYNPGEYHAYYIPDRYDNWGENVAPPPYRNHIGNGYWPALGAAIAACDEHAKTHRPKPKTVRRAAELKAEFLAMEEKHRRAA
jgi:hypothetical protein